MARTTKKKATAKKTTTKKTAKKTASKKTASKKVVNTKPLLKDEIAKYGDEPWVDVKAIVYDPKQGAKIELDWNDAFIKYLRDNGFTGADENVVIQKYIAILLRNIVTDIGEEKNVFE